LNGFGVSDHSNYPSHDTKFVYEQKRAQKQLNLERKGLVGLEISIYNKKGKLGVNKKILHKIDFKIVSEHVHIAKPFSGFFTTKARVEHWLKQPKKKQHKILKQINRLLDMELEGIRKNPGGIFAHIFRFPLNVNYLPNVLFERLNEILECLKQNNFALEVHAGHVRGYNLTKEEARQKIVAGDNTHRDFYRHLYKVVKKMDLPLSLGSDAHKMREIKERKYWKDFLEQTGISESRLITPEFLLESSSKF